MMLPRNRDLPISKKIMVSEPATPLPAATNPISEEAENVFLTKFLQIINRNSRASLNESILTDREKITKQGKPNDRNRYYVIIGDNHAESLYEAAAKTGKHCSMVKVGGLASRDIEKSSKKIEEIRKNINIETETIYIYSLFTKYGYRTQEGHAATQADGDMHVSGPVCFANKRQLAPVVRDCIPLFNAAGEKPKIILSPLPAFYEGPCCNNQTHASNAGTSSFKSEFRTNMSDVSHSLKELLNIHGVRRHRVLNPMSTALDAPPEVAWSGSNISTSAYLAMLNSIIKEAATVVSKRTIPPPIRPASKRHQSDPDYERHFVQNETEARGRARHHSYPEERSGHYRSPMRSESGSSSGRRHRNDSENDQYRYRY